VLIYRKQSLKFTSVYLAKVLTKVKKCEVLFGIVF